MIDRRRVDLIIGVATPIKVVSTNQSVAKIAHRYDDVLLVLIPRGSLTNDSVRKIIE